VPPVVPPVTPPCVPGPCPTIGPPDYGCVNAGQCYPGSGGCRQWLCYNNCGTLCNNACAGPNC
jgi:hypothetical protein